jgi:hypothetical protein
MRVIISKKALTLGDKFQFNGDEYQVITNPKDSGFQGGLTAFLAREQKQGILEYRFFNQVD